ncbi:membrane protein [Bacterioplanes sanyensis]|uniref:DMT family transporter n=1 Tax=Bacterioplanes sanyensis TaxID=1249553 RepID=UPI00167A99BD|nr:EamA family transporter [Bacterioplanes sanyensis]GGY56745.1 membrane protein [Bacterioplanes sanyensis]
MSSGQTPTRGILSIVIACFLWGTTGTAASFTNGISPFAIGAMAMGGSGILLALYARKRLWQDRHRLLQHRRLLLLGAAAVMCYPLAFYSSMAYAGIAVGSVISLACAPFFAAMFEGLIHRRWPSGRWFISFAIGATGVLMLALQQDNSVVTTSAYSLGIALGLLAAASYALYSWVAKTLIEQGINSNSAMASQFFLSSLVLLPLFFAIDKQGFSSATNTSILLYMVFGPMFLGYLLFGYGLRFISASQATLLTLLEPALATLMAVVIVGEQLTLSGWLGMAMILGCLLLQHKQQAELNLGGT